MKLTIIENTKNNIFNRQDIKAEANEDTIPSRKDIKNKLAAQIDTDVKQIVIRSIENKYGSNQLEIKAKAYDKIKDLEKFEKKHIQKRNKTEETSKEGTKEQTEASTPEVKEENKPEEKTEDKKEEKTEKPKTEEKETPKKEEKKE